MKLKTNITILFLLLLVCENMDAQPGRKSLNFVDQVYENASGEAEKILNGLNFVSLKVVSVKKQELEPVNTRSLNFGKQNGYKDSKSKEKMITKLIRSNLKMSFRISKNMNLAISYI